MRSLERRSSFERKISVPGEHPTGPRLRSEVDEVIAECIDFVKVSWLHLSTCSDSFASVPMSLVTSFLENCTDQQNHE